MDIKTFSYLIRLHCFPYSADDHFSYFLVVSSLSKLQLSNISSNSSISCYSEVVNKGWITFYFLTNREYKINILLLRMLLSFVWFADLVVIVHWANSGSRWTILCKYYLLSQYVYHVVFGAFLIKFNYSELLIYTYMFYELYICVNVCQTILLNLTHPHNDAVRKGSQWALPFTFNSEKLPLFHHVVLVHVSVKIT